VSRIVVVNEKNHTYYLNAATFADWRNSAFWLLKERATQGWYADSDEDFLKAVVAELKDGPTEMVVGQGKWERTIPTAWDLLDQRSDQEYEDVDLADLTSPVASTIGLDLDEILGRSSTG
jgi:hypothetical protein